MHPNLCTESWFWGKNYQICVYPQNESWWGTFKLRYDPFEHRFMLVRVTEEKSLNFPTTQKKHCTFFSWNPLNIPRYNSWHHWKNLLTSRRGRSRASNFSTEFDQIWVKTSGVSRGLIFGPICKCHTILESSWHTDLRFLNLEDLGGH